MNREIKFRAYDKKTKKMSAVWDISFKAWDHECSINYVTIQEDGTVDKDSTEIELMQYTGLKDKNGEEIYEGDIIAEKNRNEQYTQLHQVIYRLSSFYAVFLGINELQIHLDDANIFYHLHYEVIGNIYENPELLNGAK